MILRSNRLPGQAVLLVFLVTTLAVCLGCAGEAPAPSSSRESAVQGAVESRYDDAVDRRIKALSPEEVEALRNGEGVGMALAAELNHYPGPRHVLVLADDLELSGDQLERVGEIHEAMLEQALGLGEALIANEEELDRLFVTGTIDAESLRHRVSESARLRGELRTVHLRAHLETRKVLLPGQVALYDELRGYEDGAHAHDGGDHEGG